MADDGRQNRDDADEEVHLEFGFSSFQRDRAVFVAVTVAPSVREHAGAVDADPRPILR